MSQTVYVLMSYYSYESHWPLRAFSTKQEAEEYSQALTEEAEKQSYGFEDETKKPDWWDEDVGGHSLGDGVYIEKVELET